MVKSSLQSYDGAVFHVDILGFSALTNGVIDGISDSVYEAWGLNRLEEKKHSVLAATSLLEFRAVLLELHDAFPKVRIAQISDCAFIWSKDMFELLQAVHYFMWHAILDKGILCRGGLAYGEIISVDNESDFLGAYIVGDAVTRAAHNERRLKGCRIAMDVEFAQNFWIHVGDSKLTPQIQVELFNEVKSLIDMSSVDEYRWYICNVDSLCTNNGKILSYQDCMNITKKRMILANTMIHHPRMGWNAVSKDGNLQLSASLYAVTESPLLHVRHDFQRREVSAGHRSIANLNRANTRTSQDDEYSSYSNEDDNRYALD